jgi:hypothetical protein
MLEMNALTPSEYLVSTTAMMTTLCVFGWIERGTTSVIPSSPGVMDPLAGGKAAIFRVTYSASPRLRA